MSTSSAPISRSELAGSMKYGRPRYPRSSGFSHDGDFAAAGQHRVNFFLQMGKPRDFGARRNDHIPLTEAAGRQHVVAGHDARASVVLEPHAFDILQSDDVHQTFPPLQLPLSAQCRAEAISISAMKSSTRTASRPSTGTDLRSAIAESVASSRRRCPS